MSFVLPWRRLGNTLMLSWDCMLEIVNPLNPEGWPYSSTGAMINPSEHFTSFAPVNELEDRSRPCATMTAGFFRSTPWLPWMRMGRSGVEGRLFANSHNYKITGGLDNIPPPVRQRLEDMAGSPDRLAGRAHRQHLGLLRQCGAAGTSRLSPTSTRGEELSGLYSIMRTAETGA